ncbi:hypothetical protein [Nocardia terpenica]|uniref:hypothetical protein n=1 Tax=Nocardia terpenica TaxID=455432 RepID=UPI000AB8A6EB|nr:hypothetical protein [Nocardia terpenica]NQE88742.1 hypothetical protein [Nocardia terpenica]
MRTAVRSSIALLLEVSGIVVIAAGLWLLGVAGALLALGMVLLIVDIRIQRRSARS